MSATFKSVPLRFTDFARTEVLPLPIAILPPEARSALLDAAYEEFRALRAAGSDIDPEGFSARFPQCQSSLRRLLEVHCELEQNPALFNELGQWPEPGTRFLDYELAEELGRGAFARVYRAREWSVGGRWVVAKLSLHSDQEAGTLGRLNHDNIVPVYSGQVDPVSGLTLVIMPFLGRATLHDLIESCEADPERSRPAQRILELARAGCESLDIRRTPDAVFTHGSCLDAILYLTERIALALEAVHQRGIVHRDLKPSNVLICPDGEPLLIDFNLAHDRSLDEHRLGGTLPYMAPELLEASTSRQDRDPHRLGPLGDLYALGVILYELLTGVHPFGPVPTRLRTDEMRDFLLIRLRRGPLDPQARNARLDRALADLVLRCLDRDPSRRPPSAGSLAQELRQLRLRPARRRRGLLHVASALGLLTLLSGSTGLAIQQVLHGPASPTIAQGLDQLRGGDPVQAVVLLERAAAANPESPQAHLALAHACTVQQLFSRSNAAYLRAIALGGDSALARNNIAYNFARLNKNREAIQSATQALELDPTLAAAFYNRALARLKLFLADEDVGLTDIIHDFRQALDRRPGSAHQYYLAATACALASNDDDDSFSTLGQNWLRQALESGFNRERVISADPRLLELSTWLDMIPQPPLTDRSVIAPSDFDARVIDPSR